MEYSWRLIDRALQPGQALPSRACPSCPRAFAFSEKYLDILGGRPHHVRMFLSANSTVFKQCRAEARTRLAQPRSRAMPLGLSVRSDCPSFSAAKSLISTDQAAEKAWKSFGNIWKTFGKYLEKLCESLEIPFESLETSWRRSLP
jgi:hypothetical protein